MDSNFLTAFIHFQIGIIYLRAKTCKIRLYKRISRFGCYGLRSGQPSFLYWILKWIIYVFMLCHSNYSTIQFVNSRVNRLFSVYNMMVSRTKSFGNCFFEACIMCKRRHSYDVFQSNSYNWRLHTRYTDTLQWNMKWIRISVITHSWYGTSAIRTGLYYQTVLPGCITGLYYMIVLPDY